jgi:hypothetical protein
VRPERELRELRTSSKGALCDTEPLSYRISANGYRIEFYKGEGRELLSSLTFFILHFLN